MHEPQLLRPARQDVPLERQAMVLSRICGWSVLGLLVAACSDPARIEVIEGGLGVSPAKVTVSIGDSVRVVADADHRPSGMRFDWRAADTTIALVHTRGDSAWIVGLQAGHTLIHLRRSDRPEWWIPGVDVTVAERTAPSVRP